MKIYFVRHGQSVGNADELHQTIDMHLSGTGIAQALRIAERLKKYKIDTIFTSPAVRTRQTAEIISSTLNIPIEQWDELIEVRNPSEIGGKPIADPKVISIKKLIRENYIKGNWKYSDEENYEEINLRSQKFLNHLIKYHSNRDILCVSHATYIKFLIAKMLFGKDLTPEISHIFYHHTLMQHTGLTICEYDKENGWLIRHLNDASHL
jgi:broad specificity phosphatase PhoE